MKMRRKMTALMMTGVLCAGLLCGCGGEGGQSAEGTGKQTGAADGSGAEAGSAGGVDLSNIYSGELERNVTIRVLENDTAIEQGYFQELIDAFNEKYAEK